MNTHNVIEISKDEEYNYEINPDFLNLSQADKLTIIGRLEEIKKHLLEILY